MRFSITSTSFLHKEDERCVCQPSAAEHQRQTGCEPDVLSIRSLLSPDPESSYVCRDGIRGCDHHNKKTNRKRASPAQLLVLNRVFNQTSFPSTELRTELGKELDMSPRSVQIWFQNKRQALRAQGRTNSRRNSGVIGMANRNQQRQVPASPPLSPLHPSPCPAAAGTTITTMPAEKATAMTIASPAPGYAATTKSCLPRLVFLNSRQDTVSIAVFPRHHYQPTASSLPSPTFSD